MNLRAVFSTGWSTARRQWRVTVIVYFIQLALALTLGMQVYEVMKASIGSSLEIDRLTQHYDHTVLMDFLRVHGASITPLIGQLRWLLLVWLVFAVFLDGGMLFCAASPQETSARAFWQGGASYFFPFLKISLVFLGLFLLWTLLIWLPVGLMFQPMLEYFSSEVFPVWLVLFMAVIWLAGLGVLLVWSVLSRLNRIQQQTPVFAAVKNGARVFGRSKLRYFSMEILFFAVLGLLLAVYYHLDGLTGFSAAGVLVLFIVQQFFTFFKIQLRQTLYAGIAA